MKSPGGKPPGNDRALEESGRRKSVRESIFEYESYRAFLKDFYLESKARDKKFSFRYFARIAGFKAANFLKNVMDGKRNLSPESAERIAQALKLNREERRYFRNLVGLNQAATVDEKRAYIEEILRSRKFREIHPLKESQFRYFSHWYFIPIRELVELSSFREDPDWIARQMIPPISASEAKAALKELLNLGLLVRDPAGKLVQAAPQLSTGDELASASLAQCHRELLQRAAESIDVTPREQRDISALTLAVSSELAIKIKERIRAFRKEIMALVSGAEDASRIYQMNLQFFPIAIQGEGKKGEP